MIHQWENYGKMMGKSWENHGKIMGKSWENQGKIMGKSWENHGKMIHQNHFFELFFLAKKKSDKATIPNIFLMAVAHHWLHRRWPV